MKFGQIGAGIAAGLYLANRFINSECWKNVTDREKVNNFIITTPFSFKDKNGNKRYLYFKIAKDQGQRVACSIFENLMAKAIGEKVNGDQIAQSIQDFIPIIPEDNLPPSLEAFLGYTANKDFWTNKDIWKGEKVTPREEYTAYTHPAMVKLGKLTSLSPERLEYSLGQYFTRGNIYTSLVSGGFSLAMRDLPEKDKDKLATEIVQGLPFVRRMFRVTPPYSEAELKELEKTRIEESTRTLKQRRSFDELTTKYYRKRKEEKKIDYDLLKEIRQFVKEQPAEDRKKLADRFKNQQITYDIPDRSWWLNLAEMNPEARATVFWTKYARSKEEEKEELKKLARKIPGIWSDRFVKRLRLLLKKGNNP